MTDVNSTEIRIPNSFTTQRLRAKKATDAHETYLSQIISNQKIQEVYNTIDEAIFTDLSSQMLIIHNQWQRYGYGLYTVFDIETNDFIGFAGYHTVIIDEFETINCFNGNEQINELEIYLFLMPNYWRNGYGFEITSKLINLAFTYLPYTSIIAYIEPKNNASLQLIKKLHFTAEKSVIYNNKPHILYRLHKQ
jgi:RimJ/RimL family protein N-acetyltransferase